MMHQDYSTIDADKHAKSQQDLASREDLLSYIAVLQIQIKELQDKNNFLKIQLHESRSVIPNWTDNPFHDDNNY